MFSSIKLIVVALSAITAASAQATGATCSRSYIVQSGDFCDLISAKQNSSTYQLAQANIGLIDPTCSNLFIGENICLGIVGQDCTTVGVVASGDGCDTIAAAANITTTLLMANNPNINSGCTNIYVGEVLCTANTQIFNATQASTPA